ncbi:hypothetical protein DAPPUDRAFT_316750 [Daphnia pulex]|uniref:Hexosyltransferase n=1 Tax=Daphnia pulex TaxID=6669 RepID=E9GDV8_DAPPU|nr:hypothetical protein DAPPUDRAFT_316750 [Daphnia pulex]|eukprot:EFX82150.1 hypothetical protein DAPPUDRAFT_316750 [Daphnia pulex]
MKINVMSLLLFLTTLSIANSQLLEHLSKSAEIANKDRRVLYSHIAPTLINNPYPGVANYTLYSTARLGLLPSNAKPLMPEFGPVINNVTSFNYPITVPQCGDIDPSVRSVFIAVISAADNFERRSKIRQTWKDHIDLVLQKGLLGKIHFAFILGKSENALIQEKIQKENKNFTDIIQMELSDSYRNLPWKMAGLLNWVNTNCRQVDFVLKIDDDMCLNVHVLAHFVKTYYESGKMTIFGQSHRVDSKSNNWGPQRSDSQWQISLDEWPWNTYPNYVNGPAYLMHRTSILPLLAAIQTTPMIPFEDVYLTGICPEKAGVTNQYSTGSNRITGRNIKNECSDADRLMTWSSDTTYSHTTVYGMLPHKKIDNFYRGYLSCKPKESIQFNFRNDVSVF